MGRGRNRACMVRDGAGAPPHHDDLSEFQHVAGHDAAGRAVEQIAVDDGAQLGLRQLVVAADEIFDLEAVIRGIDWARANSRNQVFNRSRGLIDLTTDGPAFEIPGCNSRRNSRRRFLTVQWCDDPPEAEILRESARLQQNTVNDGLPARTSRSSAGARRLGRDAGAIRLMVHPERAAPFSPGQLSTLPNPYC